MEGVFVFFSFITFILLCFSFLGGGRTFILREIYAKYVLHKSMSYQNKTSISVTLILNYANAGTSKIQNSS